MLKNSIRSFWRHIQRSKFISFIHISGLAIGMTVVIMIGLWIWDVLSFDRNFKHYDRINQVMITGTFSGEVSTDPVCPVPLAQVLRDTYASDFERVVLTTKQDKQMLSFQDKHLGATGLYGEAGFNDMFSIHVLAGSLNIGG